MNFYQPLPSLRSDPSDNIFCRLALSSSNSFFSPESSSRAINLSIIHCLINALPCNPNFNPFPNKPWFLHVCITSLCSRVENTVGKGEIAHNKQFLNCRLQNPSVWKGPKFVVWERVKWLWEKCLLTLPKWQILDSHKLKELADENFKFDENGRKFCTQVENTVGKGEVARYKQFPLFPQCFQKTCTVDMYKPGFVWEKVKHCGIKRKRC